MLMKLIILSALMSPCMSFANPLIAVDQNDIVKDTDILEKIEANSKAQIEDASITNDGPPAKIEVIVDSSGSMGQILAKNKSKMFYLKKLMKEFFKARWKEKNLIGLRVYSGITPNKCTDIRLSVPFSKNKIDTMEKVVDGLTPLGMTPLHKSLEFAFEDLKSYAGPKRVVIVTDGQDTCGGDPCQTVEEWKKQNLDLKFYVIALGFKGDSESFKKIQCIGDTQVADDDESFSDAMSQIGNKVQNKENLTVISPNPTASVYLYRIEKGEKKLVRVFYANSPQTVPVGTYEAVVGLTPPYKFSEFTIEPGRKKTLKVVGDGIVNVIYFGRHLNVEVLDKDNRAIKKFRSDTPTEVPSGKWQLRIFKNPFYELILPEYFVNPMGVHDYNVFGVGALKLNSPELSGVYVYDENKTELGQFLTNSIVIMKSNVYSLHRDDNCTFDQVQVKDKREVLVLDCKK